jgi:hypothetical protein
MTSAPGSSDAARAVTATRVMTPSKVPNSSSGLRLDPRGDQQPDGINRRASEAQRAKRWLLLHPRDRLGRRASASNCP